MGQLLSYSIVSGLLMLAMYLAYRIFLARENQHGYNRAILLMIYAVSFVTVPLLTWLQTFAPQASYQTLAVEGINVVTTAETPASYSVWGTILIWVFMAGMIIVALKTAVTWARLIGVIRNGEKIKRNGYTLIITDSERFAPFSWMRFIVISRKDYHENYSAIATHELKHVACNHWIDLMIAQIVCIINWFNPAAWLMREELRLVHEYQADMAVIESGHNPQQYQMLLIKKAVGARFPSLANSLNHSKLKKRITMMYQEKSGARRKIRALALVPMLALALGVVAVPTVRAAVSTIKHSSVSTGKSSENLSTDNSGVKVFKVTNLNNNDGKTTITIKVEGVGDNITVSGGTFTTNGKTYKANELKCEMTNGEATIVATFPFVEVFDKSSMTLMVNGETIPFNLEKFFGNATDAYLQPEVLPQYPGGEVAMIQAIMSQVTFPDPERKWKKEAGGLTLVRFTVLPDGSMSNFERELSSGYGDLDQIAIDAVKNGLTEKWIPGTVDGKPVAVSYVVPIRFKTMGDSK